MCLDSNSLPRGYRSPILRTTPPRRRQQDLFTSTMSTRSEKHGLALEQKSHLRSIIVLRGGDLSTLDNTYIYHDFGLIVYGRRMCLLHFRPVHSRTAYCVTFQSSMSSLRHYNLYHCSWRQRCLCRCYLRLSRALTTQANNTSKEGNNSEMNNNEIYDIACFYEAGWFHHFRTTT